MTRNAAQIRGDIQSGVTGDKRAGFDPATAPMETDSEAAGTPASEAEIRLASRPHVSKPGHAAGAYQDAMLPPAGVAPKWGISPLLLIPAAWIALLLGGALLAALLR